MSYWVYEPNDAVKDLDTGEGYFIRFAAVDAYYICHISIGGLQTSMFPEYATREECVTALGVLLESLGIHPVAAPPPPPGPDQPTD